MKLHNDIKSSKTQHTIDQPFKETIAKRKKNSQQDNFSSIYLLSDYHQRKISLLHMLRMFSRISCVIDVDFTTIVPENINFEKYTNMCT